MDQEEITHRQPCVNICNECQVREDTRAAATQRAAYFGAGIPGRGGGWRGKGRFCSAISSMVASKPLQQHETRSLGGVGRGRPAYRKRIVIKVQRNHAPMTHPPVVIKGAMVQVDQVISY